MSRLVRVVVITSHVFCFSSIQVWNSVGLIRQYNTEEENSIDIEFHDTSTHHAMHVTNSMNHTMGDLSSEAAILACESDDDLPSRLICMHFSSWDSVKEWAVPMPDGEEIMVRVSSSLTMLLANGKSLCSAQGSRLLICAFLSGFNCLLGCTCFSPRQSQWEKGGLLCVRTREWFAYLHWAVYRRKSSAYLDPLCVCPAMVRSL